MSKELNTVTRRHFLKGATYLSALSAGGLSSMALANSVNPNQDIVGGSSAATVTLLNQSNRAIVLDAGRPVSLEKVQGWVVVKINKNPEIGSTQTTNGNGITLAAGQQRSFAVDPELAPALKETGGHIIITNEYSALDNMVPMATFDVVVV